MAEAARPAGDYSVVFVDLNEPPHLPPDGGRTSIPFLHVAYDRATGVPVGVLVVSTGGVIDMVYVTPQFRGRGVAGLLYRAAVRAHGRVGTDDRLTAAGVGFARRYRVPLWGGTRRKVTLDAAEHDRRGAAALARADAAVRRGSPGLAP